jgi:PAS domain S-box-containing protein
MRSSSPGETVPATSLGGLGGLTALPEMMLLSVLDAFDDPVSVTTAVRDREGRILDFRIEFVNAAACRWAGLAREQVVGRIVGDVLPNFRESGLFDVMTSVVDTGESAERGGLAYEDTIPGGHRISGVFDLRVVRLGDGYVSIWRDVAGRERTTAELARSTELLRAIVDSSPFATMAFDADQNLVVWSDGAERLFGWRADEVIGQPAPIEMIPIEERGESQARIRRTLGGATIAAERVRRLLKAVRSLGHDIRLAVNDAGAGVANFAHIIDLGPDFVKLDTSLVRRVNAHLGRQALIVGMRHFSRTSGCRLVAEGIETGDEARTLAELGVEFGQGYWFGRPEPVS